MAEVSETLTTDAYLTVFKDFQSNINNLRQEPENVIDNNGGSVVHCVKNGVDDDDEKKHCNHDNTNDTDTESDITTDNEESQEQLITVSLTTPNDQLLWYCVDLWDDDNTPNNTRNTRNTYNTCTPFSCPITDNISKHLDKVNKTPSCPQQYNPFTSFASVKPLLFILDWDDTLLPTSFFDQQQTKTDGCDSDWGILSELEHTIISLVQSMLTFGTVCIVTNSGGNWVKTSCQLYFPDLWQVIQDLPIISARSEFETFFPDDSYMWKHEAFQRIISSKVCQVISLGDNPFDHKVAWTVAKQLKQKQLKTFQFKICPGVSELNEQLRAVSQILSHVVHQQGDMNILLKVENASSVQSLGDNGDLPPFKHTTAIPWLCALPKYHFE